MTEIYHIFCGDQRQYWAAEQLRSCGRAVVAHGVPGCESWPLPAHLDGRVILPFPAFQGSYLRGRDGYPVSALLPRITPDTHIYGGLLGQYYEEFSRLGAKVTDLYGTEPLSTQNAIATAEGAIRLAIEQTSITLHGARCLVIGFGRIGKVLAQKLHLLSADVTICARKPGDLALAQAFGLRAETTGVYAGGLGGYDLIFNTVPAPILTAQQLAAVSPACVYIELASQPGGIPEELRRSCTMRHIFAPGLPGLCAPESAGRLYADCVLSVISNE